MYPISIGTNVPGEGHSSRYSTHRIAVPPQVLWIVSNASSIIRNAQQSKRDTTEGSVGSIR